MQGERTFEVEVCVDRVADAMTAVAAGATRIELNCALEMDGLTPAAASCQWLKQHCSVPIVAMLRPHARSFVYSASDEASILRDCQQLLQAGVDGIVFGGLNERGQIAIPILQRVLGACGGRPVVFHRAFDQLKDQSQGLEQLIECGVRRVLTSGGAKTALEGVAQLKRLHDLAEGRIEILPGAGINSRNAQAILQASGCCQLHGSFTDADRKSQGPDASEIAQTVAIARQYAVVRGTA